MFKQDRGWGAGEKVVGGSHRGRDSFRLLLWRGVCAGGVVELGASQVGVLLPGSTCAVCRHTHMDRRMRACTCTHMPASNSSVCLHTHSHMHAPATCRYQEKLPEPFNMVEMEARIKEKTPFVVVALQEVRVADPQQQRGGVRGRAAWATCVHAPGKT